MYDEIPKTFKAVLEPFPPETRRLANGLRKLVRAELPDADENVYSGKKIATVLYSIGSEANVICGIQPGGAAVKLFLHNLNDLKNPPLELEGKGKHARHVKVAAVDKTTRAALTELVRTARDRAP